LLAFRVWLEPSLHRQRLPQDRRNLTLRGSSIPELGEPVYPILKELETLERCEAEGPLDQGEVDAVGRLLKREGGRRSGISLIYEVRLS